MSTNYEELAERAGRGELSSKPGTIKRGAEAADAGRALLMQATGASTSEEAARLALGRPKVGAERGDSPVVRARVPQALKDRLAVIAAREQRNESEVIREALASYVELRDAG